MTEQQVIDARRALAEHGVGSAPIYSDFEDASSVFGYTRRATGVAIIAYGQVIKIRSIDELESYLLKCSQGEFDVQPRLSLD